MMVWKPENVGFQVYFQFRDCILSRHKQNWEKAGFCHWLVLVEYVADWSYFVKQGFCFQGFLSSRVASLPIEIKCSCLVLANTAGVEDPSFTKVTSTKGGIWKFTSMEGYFKKLFTVLCWQNIKVLITDPLWYKTGRDVHMKEKM